MDLDQITGPLSFPDLIHNMSVSRIGFFGAGNMALAIAKGLARSQSIDPKNQYLVYAPSERNLPKFASQFSCQTTMEVKEFVNFQPEVIFVCVKPQILLKPLPASFSGNQFIVSVAAGINFNSLRSNIDSPNGTFVRIMTNTACSISQGVCAVALEQPPPGYDMKQEEFKKQVLATLFSPLGDVQFVDEIQMDVITALAGSGPAFGYTFIQSLSDGAVKMGLPRSMATRFAAQALAGAAMMTLKSNQHPYELRDAVCSPGGTTIHGIHALEKGCFSSSVIDAIEAATKRGKEMASLIPNNK